MNRLVIVGILLVLIGAFLIIINQTFYVPKFFEMQNALLSWSENHAANTTPPSLEAFDLTETSLITSLILANIGGVMVFIGGAYLIIVIIRKLIERHNN